MTGPAPIRPPFIVRAFRALSWALVGRWKTAGTEAYQRYRQIYARKPIICGPRAAGQRCGRALLTYVVEPFLPDFDPADIHLHSNRWKSRELAAILAQWGYDVDVTDWENYHPPLAAGYDVVLGHGPAYERACRRRAPKCRRIYLGTIAYMDQIVAAEQKQLDALRDRRGLRLRRVYFGRYGRDRGPARSDALLLLGTDWVIDTYQKFASLPTYRWANVVVDDVPLAVTDKDYGQARRNFLWMSGYAAVHRGLDVVLEVFARLPDVHLWVCGSILHEKQFVAAYRRELFETPNIHFEGWTDVSGDAFQRIVRTCGFALYPSASDAMAGALVNQMAAGLVPLYTREAGTDCGGFGLELPEFSHAAIRAAVLDAANWEPGVLAEQSIGVSRFAVERYSKQAFRSAMTAAIGDILKIEPGSAVAH